jgi:hypothetical protein
MQRLFTFDPEHLKVHKQHLVCKVLLVIKEETCNYFVCDDVDHLIIHLYIQY